MMAICGTAVHGASHRHGERQIRKVDDQDALVLRADRSKPVGVLILQVPRGFKSKVTVQRHPHILMKFRIRRDRGQDHACLPPE